MRYLLVVAALAVTCCAEARAPELCTAEATRYYVHLQGRGETCDVTAVLDLEATVEVPPGQDCGTFTWELTEPVGECQWRVLVSAYIDDLGPEVGTWVTAIRLDCPECDEATVLCPSTWVALTEL